MNSVLSHVLLSSSSFCRYVFARECFFLFSLGRPAACAEKGAAFVTFVRRTMSRRIEDRRYEELEIVQNLMAARDTRDDGTEGDCAQGDSEENTSESRDQDVIERQLRSTEQKFDEWKSLLDFWVVISSVKLVRVCTDFVLGQTAESDGGGVVGIAEFSSISATAGANVSGKMKGCSTSLEDLLQLGTSTLLSLISYSSKCHTEQRLRTPSIVSSSSSIGDLPEQFDGLSGGKEMYQQPLQYFRRTSHMMAAKLTSWDALEVSISFLPLSAVI